METKNLIVNYKLLKLKINLELSKSIKKCSVPDNSLKNKKCSNFPANSTIVYESVNRLSDGKILVLVNLFVFNSNFVSFSV